MGVPGLLTASLLLCFSLIILYCLPFTLLVMFQLILFTTNLCLLSLFLFSFSLSTSRRQMCSFPLIPALWLSHLLYYFAYFFSIYSLYFSFSSSTYLQTWFSHSMSTSLGSIFFILLGCCSFLYCFPFLCNCDSILLLICMSVCWSKLV